MKRFLRDNLQKFKSIDTTIYSYFQASGVKLINCISLFEVYAITLTKWGLTTFRTSFTVSYAKGSFSRFF